VLAASATAESLDGIVEAEIALRVQPGIPIAEQDTRVAASQTFIGLQNLRHEARYSRGEQIVRIRFVLHDVLVRPPRGPARTPAC